MAIVVLIRQYSSFITLVEENYINSIYHLSNSYLLFFTVISQNKATAEESRLKDVNTTSKTTGLSCC